MKWEFDDVALAVHTCPLNGRTDPPTNTPDENFPNSLSLLFSSSFIRRISGIVSFNGRRRCIAPRGLHLDYQKKMPPRCTQLYSEKLTELESVIGQVQPNSI